MRLKNALGCPKHSAWHCYGLMEKRSLIGRRNNMLHNNTPRESSCEELARGSQRLTERLHCITAVAEMGNQIRDAAEPARESMGGGH